MKFILLFLKKYYPLSPDDFCDYCPSKAIKRYQKRNIKE
jgi:rRNA maturation endonuclease Nob1